MAKKSSLEKNKKCKILIKKFFEKKKDLYMQMFNAINLQDQLLIAKKLQNIPRSASIVRLRNRCWKTGRPRGYFRFFGLSRNALRSLGQDGFLPGLIKSSW